MEGQLRTFTKLQVHSDEEFPHDPNFFGEHDRLVSTALPNCNLKLRHSNDGWTVITFCLRVSTILLSKFFLQMTAKLTSLLKASLYYILTKICGHKVQILGSRSIQFAFSKTYVVGFIAHIFVLSGIIAPLSTTTIPSWIMYPSSDLSASITPPSLVIFTFLPIAALLSMIAVLMTVLSPTQDFPLNSLSYM